MEDRYAVRNPDAFLDAAVDKLCNDITNRKHGSRNVTIRAAFYNFGTLMHLAGKAASHYEDRLLAAARDTGLPLKEINQVVRRAIRDGKREPQPYYVDTAATGERVPRLRVLRSFINDPPPANDNATPNLDDKGPDPISARGVWANAVDAKGTPAERYLNRRGLDMALVAAEMRYARSADYHYCIFPVRNADGEIVAIQRVTIDDKGEPWSTEDGKKRKLSLGPVGDGLFVALDGDGPPIVCEGPEDAISIAAALLQADKPRRVVATLGSVTRAMEKGAIVFADNGPDLAAVESAARATGALVCTARKPLKDANDVYVADGPAGILSALESAEEPDRLHIETLAQLILRVDAMPPKHVLWSRFRSREVAMVFGRSNAGKTNFLFHLTTSLVEYGSRFLGEPATLPDDRPVLWLSGEQDAEDWRSRVGMWRNDRLHFAELRRRINVNAPPPWLEEAMEAHAAIVLDTALTSLVYADGRSTESVGSALLWNALHENIKPLVQRHNSALLISHHAPKNGDTGNTPYGDMAENSMDQILHISRAAGREVDGKKADYPGATGVADWYKVRGNTFPEKIYFNMVRETDPHMKGIGWEGRLLVNKVPKNDGGDG